MKLKQINFKTKDGSVSTSWRFAYYQNGKPKYLQSKNKSFLKEKAKQISAIIQNAKTNKEVFLVNAWWFFEDNYESGVDTLKDYRSYFNNYILKYLGDVDLATLSEEEIKQWCNKIKQTKLKKTTQIKIYNTFALVYQAAVDQNLLSKNLVKAQTFYKKTSEDREAPQIDFNVWTNELIESIINNVKDYKVQLMFKLMLQTAMRPSEVRALSKQNLIFNNTPHITITHALTKNKKIKPPKTKAGKRWVIISSALKLEILKYINTLPKDQKYLFLNTKSNFIDLKYMTTQLNDALKLCKVKLPLDRKLYFFRHYAASYWSFKSRYKDPQDFAFHFGDKDINFIKDNYIKNSPNPNTEKYNEDNNFVENNYNTKSGGI